MSQESGYEFLDIAIHPRKSGEPWQFKLKEFEAAIQNAKTRLRELRKHDGGAKDVDSKDR